MNRKQKIIVSITGIFLVLMILVGLTYAYFLTKITGNTNTKSISVSTANLVLEYGENTNVVQGIENAEPGYSVEKIFTATNKGNSTVTYGAALENIVNELSRQQDLVYTLTCTSYLKSGFSLASDGTITGTVDGTCNGVTSETKFPSTSDLSIMVNNTIDTTHTHAYKLIITYKEMGVDQSEDMNKTFSAKVNIVDLNAVARNNPYKDNKNSLAYNIINNAINNVNGTELLATPKTIPGKESTKIITGKRVINSNSWQACDSYYEIEEEGPICGYNETVCTKSTIGRYIYDNDNQEVVGKIVECNSNGKPIATVYGQESVLSITNDDYGTSYYYRGQIEDNYVNFAGMCWRIVRISGDGSVKLILDDKSNTCDSKSYTGYWYDSNSGSYGTLVYSRGEKTASDGTTNPYVATYIPDYLNDTTSGSYANYSKTFQNTLKSNLGENKQLANYLKSGDWCLNEIGYIKTKVGNNYQYSRMTAQDIIDYSVKGNVYVYGPYLEIDNPTLKCSGSYMKKFADGTDMFVSSLTLGEVQYAGAMNSTEIDSNNKKYYLFNSNSDNINDAPATMGTISLSERFGGGIADTLYPYQYSINKYGAIESGLGGRFRPAVQLKNGIAISKGDGTQSNPYVID